MGPVQMPAGVGLQPCLGRHSNPVWAQWAGMPSAAGAPSPCWLERQMQPQSEGYHACQAEHITGMLRQD